MVRMDSFSSVPPHIQPPMAQVPSAIRELTRFVPAMLMYSSMVILSRYLVRDRYISSQATVGWHFSSLNQLLAKSVAGSRPPIVFRNQMSLLFHFQNYRREILFLSLLRLPCISLKSSSSRGHSPSNSSREIENQREILVH